jgi:hypothetical protein
MSKALEKASKASNPNASDWLRGALLQLPPPDPPNK